MKEKNSGVGLAVRVGEDVPPRLDVVDRLVDVHRRARLARHRLRHEGRVHVVAERRLADRPLELEHLVGEHQRVAVAEIDLHLRGALLVDQRVDLEVLRSEKW